MIEGEIPGHRWFALIFPTPTIDLNSLLGSLRLRSNPPLPLQPILSEPYTAITALSLSLSLNLRRKAVATKE